MKEEGAKKAEEEEESGVVRLCVIDIVISWSEECVDRNYGAAAFSVCELGYAAFPINPIKIITNFQVQKF